MQKAAMEEHELLLTQPPSPSSIESQNTAGYNVTKEESSPFMNNEETSNANHQARDENRPSNDDLLESKDDESDIEIRTSMPFSSTRYEEALRNLPGSSSSSDDDESSISSSDSELDLSTKRERNVARNDSFLSKLNAKYRTLPTKFGLNPKIKADDAERDEMGIDEPIVEPRGMLFNRKSPCLSSEKVDSTLFNRKDVRRLREMYPFREYQINILSSLIDASVGQIRRCQQSKCVYVPAPLLVTGPSGTGKTSVVRDVIDAVKQGRESLLNYAYVNCAILEPSSIDRLVSSATSQLIPFKQRRRPKQKRKKRKRMRSVGGLATQSDFHLRTNNDAENSNGDIELEFTIDGTSTIGDDSVAKKGVHPSPGRNVKSIGFNDRNDPNISNKRHRRVKLERKVNVTGQHTTAQQPTLFSPQRDGKSKLLDSNWSLNSVVSSFGRTLQPVFGRGGGHGAILVLDHADRLLSLSMKKSSNDRTNFLSELLLLPKAMELNLTIIVITSNCCLDSSRLNSLVAVDKSVSTLSNGIQPYVIQFPAYRGLHVFTKILCVPKLISLIVGDQFNWLMRPGSERNFRTRVVDAFLATLVQSLSNSTRDIRELVRVGRAFFPIYIEPLHPSHIDKTLELAGKNLRCNFEADQPDPIGGIETSLLEFLDKKFFREAGKVLSCNLFSLSIDSPVLRTPPSHPRNSNELSYASQPYIRVCLLLAAYICQNNKSDKDRQVFSIQGKGRKRTRNQPVGNSLDDIAFISRVGDSQQLKVVRPRPFPLERMLSIFVTIYQLNPSSEDLGSMQCGKSMLQSLGSSYLYQNLANLRDLGYLHEVQTVGQLKSEQLSISSTKYWCSLSRAEATSISQTFDIPLNSYLL